MAQLLANNQEFLHRFGTLLAIGLADARWSGSVLGGRARESLFNISSRIGFDGSRKSFRGEVKNENDAQRRRFYAY